MQYGGGELFLPLGATCHQRDRDAPRSGRVVLSTLHEDENAAGGGGSNYLVGLSAQCLSCISRKK